MPSYNQVLHEYLRLNEKYQIEESSIRLYLLELCQRYNINLYLDLDNEINSELYNEFKEGMIRIFNHEPLYYVFGEYEFYGNSFIVNKDVLIPRFETEELVYEILDMIQKDFQKKDLTIIDVGTGSGIIGLSLKSAIPDSHVTISDISKEALEVAKTNAKRLNLDVDSFCGNMLDPFIDNQYHVDVLVCNPPYIPDDEVIEDEVKNFEPNVALFGGEGGLKYYKEIFENAHKILNDHYLLAFEIGYQQKEVLMNLAKEAFLNAKVEVRKDMNNKDRMLFIYN